MNRILIAEDEPRIFSFLDKGLRANGFATAHAADAQTALELSCSDDFDLLILDLGLPGKDGLEIVRELRGRGERLPVLILTARDDLDSKIAGLEGGADDYVTKPFRFEELLARIRVRLRDRRQATIASASSPERQLRCGTLILDLNGRQVWSGDHLVELSNREFALLETFLRHPGQVLSRTQLLDRIWGYSHSPDSNVVDAHVRNLRRKIGKTVVETVRGVGYRLNGDGND
ncbi:MAG: response regulator transcription factor [Chloroflexaceae bacterium]|nr:response regulator transcription factor [Chloroflexaceae bacterium]